MPVLAGGRSDGTSVASLMQCRNRFVDPYCSGWFRALLGEQVEQVVRARLDAGGSAAMVVFTSSHVLRDSLAGVMRWQQAAWKRMLQQSGWRGLGLDWLRVLDVVVGGPSGPHPHHNVVQLVDGEMSETEWERLRLRQTRWWARCLEVEGWRSGRRMPVRAVADLLLHGVRVRPIHAGNVGAVSRYAARHVEGAGGEAVSDRHKRQLGGFSLMELACMAHQGQEAAGRLLAVSASDLVGRRSWIASDGWRAAVDAADATMIEDESDADAVIVGRWQIGVLPAGSYMAHREALDVFMDSMAGEPMGIVISGWRAISDRLGLSLSLLDPPIEYGPQ